MIRRHLLVATAGILASALLVRAAEAATVLTDPTSLAAGGTVSPLNNGASGTDFSEASGWNPTTYAFNFSATGGPVGSLFENIVQYPSTSSAHPYGSGLMFDFRISLTSGDITSFGATGFAGYDTSVKQCDFVGCSNVVSGAIGATGASRSADGNEVEFSFSGLSGASYTGNFQIFTNATNWADPHGILLDSDNQSFSINIAGPVSAVPEPSTWAMMLLGFAGLGFAGYRKAKKPRATVAV